jgi:phosphoribosylformimino-5-aminoimidazole carboxamide ribotide isomerase
MIIYPAIDLKDGQCVRLRHGDFEQLTVYNSNPGDQADQFAKAGTKWIHCVDLDGAVAGKPVNIDAVKSILASGMKLATWWRYQRYEYDIAMAGTRG